ncbi:MAG: right-handed parallel beta-helix repeat-containing protein, partial [Planctomycetota bacterium]
MNGRTNLDMVLAVCVFLAALAGLAAADTHYVSPGESIQAAIDDPCTVNGDEIVVAQGTYVGGINFNGKAITLYSSGGPEVTTIDGRLAESFREDFNDGDYTGWQIVDQGNYSTPSSWSAATGEMVQSSNIYTEPTSDWRLLGTYALCTQDMPWGDYEVSLSIKSVDDDWMGVMFRYVDSDNYYRFAWNGSNGNRRLVKMVNGAVTTLQQDASTYVGDQWYRARIAVRGENLRVFVDDVKVFDVNDASFSNGAIALYCWANAGTYFDNIEVKYPAYHVVQCVSGEDGNTILEGFTITGGNANGPWPDDAGGGMFNASSSPTVINCKFINNSGTYCGGMFNDTSSPIVTNCNFISNSALIGGGMSNAYSSSPTVTNCTFSDNHVSYDGGGMFNDTVSPTVTNCTFGGNFADQYGGGMYNRNCSPTLTNCTFSGNTAYDGGGMYNNDGSSPTLSTCTFSNNTASHNAGGMNNTNSSNPTMTDCNFTENEAGGGGGMINSVNCSPTIINCVYMGNSANYGGGIYNNDNSNPIVTNCTFTNNEANTGGGAIHNGGSSPTVTNCILWGDTPNEIYDDGTSSTTVNYSDVLWSGAGGNNIYGDPVFLDAASGDLRLGSCSPCVDAGDNNAVPAGVTTDLDGNPRFVDDANVPDTGIGTPPIVDMGAYERQISSFAPICNVTKGVWYCKIQVAIDDPCTVNGDEIVVAPGTYYEAINFNGKAVRLYSSGGPNDTAIDAAGLNSSVVTCNSGEDANTILEGFTITGGMGTTVSGDKCGGGMYNYSNSSPMVTNCNFNNNTAIYGGGMCNNLNSSPTLTNCTFSSNTANYYGGGMWNSSNSNPNVTNCIFNGNEAEISGGGMFNNGTSPTVKNCTFRGNSVGYRGGGMYNNVGNPTVNNCSFAENSAANAGGGMYNNGANPTVTNCTFTQNVGNISGGGIYTAGGSPTVTNCILWGDTAPTGPEIFGGSPIVKYSDVDGGWPGAGNINISPFFVDAGAGDLRLRWYSPCVDSGDNNAPLLPATDLAGNPRVMDGDGDGNSIVDMGAYELEAGMVKVGIGTLEVTIEPNEAIDAGAKWKVEGGEQWYNSGEVVSVAPGYHRVEVNELPGWYEPETLLVGYDSLDPNNVWPQNLWVRVIGDMNATATSEYSPVPVFAIGEIPPRDAPHGRTLEFYVDANWLGDDVSFSLTTTFDPNYPEPEGPILIDPCSGLFTYEPNDANDRTAFAVTFRAESGVDVNEQSVEITPIADLALEYEIVSRPVHDLPDPCDHIFVNEILS